MPTYTNLPETLDMRVSKHGGDPATGRSFQHLQDLQGLGVHLVARRETGWGDFTQVFYWDWLPNRSFDTYAELVAAANQVHPDEVQREMSRYPTIRNLERVPRETLDDRTQCDICAGNGIVKRGFMRVAIAVNWVPDDDSHVELCEEHRELSRDITGLCLALSEAQEKIETFLNAEDTGEHH